MIRKSTSAYGSKIWEGVAKVAEHTPDWMRPQIKEAAQKSAIEAEAYVPGCSGPIPIFPTDVYYLWLRKQEAKRKQRLRRAYIKRALAKGRMT